MGWAGWTFYNYNEVSTQNAELTQQLNQAKANLAKARASLAAMPYDVARVRNVIEVATALDGGKINFTPLVANIAAALNGDAVVLSMKFNAAGVESKGRTGTGSPQTLEVTMRLSDVITSAQEAVQTSRRLNQSLMTAFGAGYKVTTTLEPVGAQASKTFTGGFGGAGGAQGETAALSGGKETFLAGYKVEKAAP